MSRSVKITTDPEGPGDLVGAAEAAEIVGVERNRIPRWRAGGKMPTPIAVLKATPVWLLSDINRLAEEHRAAQEKKKKRK